MKNKKLFIGSQCVNKKSQDLACQSKRLFPTQLTWQWSMNMIKRQQCLGAFTMLLLEGSSEIGLFRDLSAYFFGVCSFENRKVARVIFFENIKTLI